MAGGVGIGGMKVGTGTAASRPGVVRGDTEDGRLRKACEDLESVFVEYLIREMRRTVPKDDLFGGGRGEEIFQGMFDQEIAKKMSSRGGFGLSKVLYRQLSGHTTRGSG